MSGKTVISSQHRVFDGFFKIDEFEVAHRRADGSISDMQRRLVFERGDAVAVLLFNPEREVVVVVEQFRLPALIGRRRDDPSADDGELTEAVAGMIDGGESSDDTARREVFEETGYLVRNLVPIGRFFASPGGTSERIFLYCADVTDADRDGPGGGIGDEDVRVVEIAINEVFARLDRGGFEDPKLIIAAYWLRERLRGAR
jgi:ADP-ribose pyrophosphatase